MRKVNAAIAVVDDTAAAFWAGFAFLTIKALYLARASSDTE